GRAKKTLFNANLLQALFYGGPRNTSQSPIPRGSLFPLLHATLASLLSSLCPWRSAGQHRRPALRRRPPPPTAASPPPPAGDPAGGLWRRSPRSASLDYAAPISSPPAALPPISSSPVPPPPISSPPVAPPPSPRRPPRGPHFLAPVAPPISSSCHAAHLLHLARAVGRRRRPLPRACSDIRPSLLFRRLPSRALAPPPASGHCRGGPVPRLRRCRLGQQRWVLEVRGLCVRGKRGTAGGRRWDEERTNPLTDGSHVLPAA
ncbi:hypothetical protein BRADI_1g27373v3, partial [Brachypodium distachyon]